MNTNDEVNRDKIARVAAEAKAHGAWLLHVTSATGAPRFTFPDGVRSYEESLRWLSDRPQAAVPGQGGRRRTHSRRPPESV